MAALRLGQGLSCRRSPARAQVAHSGLARSSTLANGCSACPTTYSSLLPLCKVTAVARDRLLPRGAQLEAAERSSVWVCGPRVHSWRMSRRMPPAYRLGCCFCCSIPLAALNHFQAVTSTKLAVYSMVNGTSKHKDQFWRGGRGPVTSEPAAHQVPALLSCRHSSHVNVEKPNKPSLFSSAQASMHGRGSTLASACNPSGASISAVLAH